MNLGGGGVKRSGKTFAKAAKRIFAGPFLARSRATCRDLKLLSVSQRGLTKGFTGSEKSRTKAFPKVSLDESLTYALDGEAAPRHDYRKAPAAQYAASRAHAGLQLPRARQLEAFHGEDVRSTST